MESDIEDRLRRYFVTQRNQWNAADEIERLRAQINGLKNGFEGCCPVCEPVGEMNKKLREERDEARRMYCEEAFCHRFNERGGEATIIDSRQIAHSMGWDCYKENKENTND